MANYPKVSPGESVMPEMQGYKMACCDCALVHSIDFKVVKVTGRTGDVFHTVEPSDADSLRVVLTADRDDEETDRWRASLGISDDPGLDALITNMVTRYPLIAVAHAFNRVDPGMREILAHATVTLANNEIPYMPCGPLPGAQP